MQSHRLLPHDGPLSAQRQAIEIVALPIDAREERYTLISKAFKEAAIEMGKQVSQAEEAVTRMVEWTRSTVMIIEAEEGAAMAFRLGRAQTRSIRPSSLVAVSGFVCG